MTQGYAAPEVESVYLRTKTLCEQFGGLQQSIHVLGGAVAFYVVGGQMRLAQETAERCLVLAEAQEDPDLLFDAHLAVGIPSYFLGEFAMADEHLRPALASRPREKHLLRASTFHPSPYLLGLCYSAHVSWQLGYPDRALEQADEALALARQSLDRFGLACVLAHLGCFHKHRRDESFVERVAEFVGLDPSDEFQFYGLFALHHQGVAAVRKGDTEGGMATIVRARAAFRAAGIGVREPCHHIDMAEACIAAGRFEQAFRELHAAWAASQRGPERCMLPEIYRVYGDVCLAAPEGTARVPLSADEADLTPESAFSAALARARETAAKTLELRAAVSLGQLWSTQGRWAEAQRLVRTIYDSFTEGHGCADLQRARDFLLELGPDSAA